MQPSMQHTTANCGVVIRKTPHTYHIQTGNARLDCQLTGSLKKNADANLITIGDVVTWNDAGQITAIHPRRNWFSRRSAVPMPGAWPHEQIIVANVDQVIAVFAVADSRIPWNLLDRYLVSAEAAEIPALICFTKLDLIADTPQAEEIDAVAAEYRAIGYEVVLTSTMTGRGLDDLRAQLQDRLSVLVGKSGVGKTSLLNALEPGLARRVQSLSNATGKGRHTTSASELVNLACGGALVDTPGMREFGLWDVIETDLDWFFPEMRPYLGQCKFGLDCQHNEEPGCAVRQAVVTGAISPYRYQSYLKLRVDS